MFLISDSVNASSHDTSPEDCDTIRNKSKMYWQQFEPTLCNIMCTSIAESINDEEADEILSCLPSCKGGKILELGAGIGRHTSKLAEMTGHVLAVDFVEEFTRANEKANKHLGNVSFLCSDATKLKLPDESFDLVFSSWLLIYLLEPDIEKLTKKILSWLKPNGYFFCRESCYAAAGNLHKQDNPAEYRPPSYYFEVLQQFSTAEARLEIQHAANVSTFIRAQGNPNQIMMLFKKVTKENGPEHSLSRMGFDKDPLSAGDIQNDIGKLGSLWLLPCLEMELLNLLTATGLIASEQVLTIGFGMTQIPFSVAGHFDVFVRNVDYNISSFLCALENQRKNGLRISKKIHNIYSTLEIPNLPVQQYDVIICEQHHYTPTKIMSVARIAKELLRPSGHLILAASVKCAARGVGEEFTFLKDIITRTDLCFALVSSGFTLKDESSKRNLLVEGGVHFLQNMNIKSGLHEVEAEVKLLQEEILDWRTIIAQKL